MPINLKGEQWQPEEDQALHKSRAELETFQTLYESLPCICFTLNLAGKILYVSQFAADCLGYDTATLTQKSITSVFHPEDQAKCQSKLTALQQQLTQMSQWQARLVGKSGNTIWVKVVVRLVAGTQGDPIINLVCEDITAHKQMEETLRESEARFRAAAEGSLDAFFIFHSVRDEQGNIVDFAFAELNANAEQMISMSKHEVIGQRLCELFPINRTGGFFEKYVRVVETGVVLEEEFAISTPGIKASWLQHQVIPLQDGIAITSRDISDRKAAEQALLEREECFRATFLAATIGMSHCDPMGRFLRVNQKFCETVGYTEEELLTRTLWDITFPDDLAVNLERGRSLLVGEIENYSIENRYIHKDGPIVWVHQTVSVVRESTGEPKHFVVVVADISARKLAEKETQQTRNFLQTTIDHLPVAVFVKDGKEDSFGAFRLWNKTSERMFGVTAEQAIGKTVHDLFPKEQADFFYQKDREAFERGTPEDIPEEFIDSYSLGRRILHTVKVPLYDENHEPKYLLCISEDITESKLAEAARTESEARLRLALDAAQMGTWDWNISTNEIVYSDQLGLVFGLPRGTSHPTYEAFLSAVHPEDRESLEKAVTRALKEGVDYGTEFRVIGPDGSLRWVGNKGQVLFDQTRKPRRMLGVLMDITDRKQAEETLRQQYLKERLVATIAGRIHQSLNLEEILNTTVAEVRQFLECDRAIIFRLDADGSGVVVVESAGSDWIPISGTIINDRYFAQTYTQLYQQGRVQALEDIYTAGLTPCHVDLLARFQVRANLVVPIVHEEKLWGLLVAQQCSGTRQWQALEIDLLKSLATQTAIAIQQSELYQQAQTEIIQRQQTEEALQQQYQRERLVGAIVQRIRQSLNLEEILERTAAEVRQVLQTDRVIIFRFKPDWSGEVVVESVDESWLSILGANIYDPCFGQSYISLYQQGRVRTIEDIQTANLSQCHVDLLTHFQVRANLVVPILQSEQTIPTSESKSPNRLWGLLIAHHCSEPRQWQQFEIDLLSALAAQAAIAIQQSQLYEQAKSQVLRERVLNQLTQAIRRSLDLNTIFSTAVDQIGELLQADCAQIVQYLPDKKLWLKVSEYQKSLVSPATLGIEISDENNQIASKLKRLEVVRIDDTTSVEDESDQDVAHQRPGAWLIVPLRSGSSVWGALGLVMNVGPYHWQDSQVELSCEVADQLAIAIQQAELYEQSRTATAQARTQATQLEQALIELQKTQTHLVQSEKMSSLGQLVAGVAHEINNPVSFIYGNLSHASGYIQDLLGLIQLYQQHYPNPKPDVQLEVEAIDLDFLIEDLPKILDSMRVGAERICEIVYSLRNFSRVAEAEMKAVDIHEGLDSTLVILQNRLKASGKHPKIQVIKEYGNLPRVECYAGQLNQVFMNLLTNAIDAIDEQNQMRTPEEVDTNPSIIRVRTEVLDNYQVAIRIADNGPGMTEQVKARLFDPFFTTKAVGAGTGLGLSISYQIVVEKHRGQIHCFSQLGKGTEFVIQIPLVQEVKD
jgi:PAS domain S-box-containing protein